MREDVGRLHTPRSERGVVAGGGSNQPAPAALLVELDQRHWRGKEETAGAALSAFLAELDERQE